MGTDAKCNNSNCTSKEDVEKLFKNSFLEFIFVENFIDVYNYTNPISEMWDNKAYQLSTSYSLDIKLKFENFTIITDDGLIFSSINQIETYVLKEIISRQILPNDDSIFFDITLGLSNGHSIVERKYMKIQDIFASAGGIINSLNLIGSLMVTLIRNFRFNFELINSYFEIEDYFESQDFSKKLEKVKDLNEGKIKENSDMIKRDVSFSSTYNI